MECFMGVAVICQETFSNSGQVWSEIELEVLSISRNVS